MRGAALRVAMGVVGALALAPWLAGGSAAVLDLCTQLGVAVVLCLSFQWLLAQGGMLSFGHAVYSGAGAYAVIHALRASGVDGTAFGLPVAWLLPALPLWGGLAGLALALPLGWLCTRQSGTAFAMVTLGLGELVWAAALMWPGWFGGDAGVSANRAPDLSAGLWHWAPPGRLHVLVLAYVAAALAAVAWLAATPLGHLLDAVRDNPARAAFLGVHPPTVRWLGFAAAGGLAGVAGGLAALQQEIVTPEVFSAQRSGLLLVCVCLAGSGTRLTHRLLGAALAAVLLVLEGAWGAQATPARGLYLGLALMAGVLWWPGGLVGAWQRAGRLVADGWRVSGWRLSGWRLSGWRVAAGALAGAGGVLLVELLYQRQQAQALGRVLRLFGLDWPVDAPWPWLAGLGLLAGGGGVARLRRRIGAASGWRA